tara:strand:- start:176 stop:1180 length:1005 start_codon:yes stop_codon:yes gene_type:complete
MTNFYIIIFFIILNLIFLIFFKKIKLFHKIIDKPDNIRKFHTNPTPLAGGIILIINIFLYFALYLINENILSHEVIFKDSFEFKIFIISCFLFFFIGAFDDMYNLRPSIKFFLLSLLTLMVLYFDSNLRIEEIRLSFLDKNINSLDYSIIFTLFCFVVFINSFNMFDGINLQASIYSIILITTFLIYLKFSLFLKILLIFIICFKYLNFRNKSFLGDSGSLLISFIISFVFIRIYNENIISFSDEIFIYMMIPGIDMVRLFFERILTSKSPFSDDRKHIHHLLLNKFSYLKTIIIITLLILIPILLNTFSLNKILIILLAIIGYSILLINVKKN